MPAVDWFSSRVARVRLQPAPQAGAQRVVALRREERVHNQVAQSTVGGERDDEGVPEIWRPGVDLILFWGAPYSSKRNSSFRTGIRWRGRTYWCKR